MFQAIAAAAGVGGSIMGALGARKRAKDQRKALDRAVRDIQGFTKDQIKKSDELGKTKQTYLESGDPFADMGGFIFGNKTNLANLRTAQSDFSRLAAGDTAPFQREVASIVQGALSNTFGGPRGSFENLSAKNLFSLRQGGMQSALGLADFFNRTGTQLTSNKFGILDQTFNRELALKQNETNMVNQLRQQRAETAGVEQMALGNVLNSLGGAASSLGATQMNMQSLQMQSGYTNRYLGVLEKNAGMTQPAAPANQPSFMSSLFSL